MIPIESLDTRTLVITLIKVRKQPHAVTVQYISLNIMSIFCFGNNIGKQLKIELVVVYQVIPVWASLCIFIFSLSLMI